MEFACQRSRQRNIFICKCVDSALNPDYETVDGPDLVSLSPDAVKDLSHDQKYDYKMVKALTSGVLTMEMANCAIVLIGQSHWLTTATRFLRLWVSQHWDTGENLCRLREIIKFTVGVYYSMWFMIKTRYSWTQGPAACPAAAQVCQENEPKCPGPDWKIH